jgi:WhiB family redox-sensing transcriptional regulator
VAAVEFVVRREATDDAWMTKAACRGLSHLFFAPAAERPQTRARREAMARQVCQSCPVMITCREYARKHHEYGLWGAETEDERHQAGYRLIAPIGVRARTAS